VRRRRRRSAAAAAALQAAVNRAAAAAAARGPRLMGAAAARGGLARAAASSVPPYVIKPQRDGVQTPRQNGDVELQMMMLMRDRHGRQQHTWTVPGAPRLAHLTAVHPS